MLHLLATGGQSQGDNVQDEFPHNRNKTFMTLQPRRKSERSSSSHWLTGSDAARGRHGSRFWIMSERQKKRSPPAQPGCPIRGDLRGLLFPFSATLSLLVSQPDDAFNYGRCLHQTATGKIGSVEKLLVVTTVTVIGQI